MTLEETLKQYFEDRYYNTYQVELNGYLLEVKYGRSMRKSHTETFYINNRPISEKDITEFLGGEDWIFTDKWEEV